jgi:eukaryotic-like serine/threonine-protein kinase
LRVGDQLGSYRITGHFIGTTYRAVHVETARRALIDIGSVDNWRAGGVAVMRAQRVLDSMRHPGIVRITEYGMLGDRRTWLATEVPSGIALYELIGRRVMPPLETAALIRDVADVLAYAHALGVVHRALTLRSITMATGRRTFPLAIADWGLHVAELGAFGAPELSTTLPYDGRVDVYALGVIAFRAATGRFPGEGGVFEVGDAPPGLAALITRMLAIDPNERPASVQVKHVAQELVSEIMDTRPFARATGHSAAQIDDVVHAATPRFAKPRWTPAPATPITSERAPTASGVIIKKST